MILFEIGSRHGTMALVQAKMKKKTKRSVALAWLGWHHHRFIIRLIRTLTPNLRLPLQTRPLEIFTRSVPPALFNYCKLNLSYVAHWAHFHAKRSRALTIPSSYGGVTRRQGRKRSSSFECGIQATVLRSQAAETSSMPNGEGALLNNRSES